MSPDSIHWNSFSEANKKRLLCTSRGSFLLCLDIPNFSVSEPDVYLYQCLGQHLNCYSRALLNVSQLHLVIISVFFKTLQIEIFVQTPSKIKLHTE